MPKSLIQRRLCRSQSHHGSATINTIVTAIMNNNPGRQIPLNKSWRLVVRKSGISTAHGTKYRNSAWPNRVTEAGFWKARPNFFKELEERKKKFGIADIQISFTTLNEVFLNIAKKAELESATAEGRLTTLTLTSGVSFQIPIGSQ